MNELASFAGYVAIFMGVLLILVVAHELGHFVAAKLAGVTVREFGIGYPPRLFAIRFRGTDYSINLLPLGGFVKLLGEEDPQEGLPEEKQRRRTLALEDAPKPRAAVPLASKRPWVRLLILAAGPGMNALLPLLLLSIAFALPHEVMSGSVRIAEVVTGSPAQTAGLESGDVVLTVDHREVRHTQDAVAAIRASVGSETAIAVKRGNEIREVRVVPRENPPAYQGTIGVVLSMQVTVATVTAGTPAAAAGFRPGDRIVAVNGQEIRVVDAMQLEPQAEITVLRGATEERLRWNGPRDPAAAGLLLSGPSITMALRPPHEAVSLGMRATVDLLALFADSISSIITTDEAVVLTGPIGIARTTAAIAEDGLPPLLYWVAFLSLNLAILNSLPIPMLDGGRMFFVFIEWVGRGWRLAPKAEGFIHLGGFAFLLGVTAVVTYHDIIQLLGT